MGKRHESIERMKAITAKYLTNEKYVIENGTLAHAGIETVNGIAIVSITVVFNSGGACIIGARSAGQYIPTYKSIRGSRYGFEAMLWLMAVAGVDRSEDLVGRLVRVAFDKDGLAQYIGHITNDIWFSFDDLAQGIHAEDEAAKARSPMERNNYITQLRYAGIVPRVKNRLRAENIPFEAIQDSITVAPEHVAVLQRITDEVMPEIIQSAHTAMDASRYHEVAIKLARKRELAEKCTRYYPVMQRCKGFDQQVAAAETIEGVVKIKDMMERRNRTEKYFIGPRTIVFSDELAALEFEPTESEKAEMKKEAAIAAAKMNQSLQIDPEEMKRQLERGFDDQGGQK